MAVHTRLGMQLAMGPAILGGMLVPADGTTATPRLKVPFFRQGSWIHPIYGEIQGDEPTLSALVANFAAGVLGRAPYLRIGHDNDAVERPTFGDTPALGWVTDVVREGQILYALVEPTNQWIVEDVASKTLRYASAEWDPHYLTKTDPVTDVGPVLLCLALTNEPFLTDLGDVTVVLADRPPVTIALDYALPAPKAAGKEDTQVSDKIEQALEAQTGILTKLSDWITGGGKPPAAVVAEPPKADDAAQKLAEAQQAAATAQAQLLAERTARETAEKAAHATRVEAEATRLVAAGIPPVVVTAFKPLLLAARGERQTIKLADPSGAEADAPLYDRLVAGIEALPDAHRVKFSQNGTVESKPPGEHDTDPNDPAVQEKARKLAAEYAGMAGSKLADPPKGNGTH
jgi:hypothetical protein